MKLWLLILLTSTSAFAQLANPDLPNPQTLTRKYLEELAKRKVGQTKFVIKEPRWEQQEQQQEESEEREIQEADVYKIGSKDKKELFLLNNYRGFQVVSFKNGLERPELIGRIPIYNNWSSEMYYLEGQQRVVILNTEWSYSMNNWSTNYNTSIYLVDVSDSTDPKVLKETNIPGYLENSRMVGDVLYTITNNGSWSDQGRAQITSLKLTSGSLKLIDETELHSQGRWVQTMNVVQSDKKYYVMASLSGSSAGNLVVVYDISSPTGVINKILTAQARGQISEKSQTFIHKNHLFALSNYRAESNLQRVSVESYPLIKNEQVVVSAANMRFSVGDTNGLHASLQDVRVSGDYLYAFWVPANNIDPFELFDIADPSKGIKHLGQLQFDGWISKSFPIDFNNRKFVLGLGWITPANSESGRRHPQAKLFEIKNISGAIKHEVVSSLTLESDEYWADLNTEDKNFEILQDNPGEYNILFPVTFMKNWKQGAKVINLDLNKEEMSEGASVIGNQGWLKRVFVNREIRGVHAFSDEALSTFKQDDLPARGIAETVSILELARNILDFHVLSNDSGLQIVKGKDSVELRQVSLTNSDAERTEASIFSKIDGSYEWHKIIGQKLHVITSFYKPRPGSEYYWSRKFDHANFTVLDLVTGASTTKKIEISAQDQQEYFWFSVDHISSGKNQLFTIAGEMFILEGNGLRKLKVNDECKYFFVDENYEFTFKAVNDSIYAYNAFSVEAIDMTEEQQDANSYLMPFAKVLEFNDGVVSCSASMNLPGKPVVKEGNYLIAAHTVDSWEYGCEEEGDVEEEKSINYSFEPSMTQDTSKTYSLKTLDNGEMELVDILGKDITAGISEAGLITFTGKESRLDIWKLDQYGQFFSRPHYLETEDDKELTLVTIQRFNERNFVFMKKQKLVDVYEMTSNGRLNKLDVTSTFDMKKSDGSAENVFDVSTIRMSPDQSRFFISQGMYGMTDIILQ